MVFLITLNTLRLKDWERGGGGGGKPEGAQAVCGTLSDWRQGITPLRANPMLCDGLGSLNSSSFSWRFPSSLFFRSRFSAKNVSSHTNPDEPDLLNVATDLWSSGILQSEEDAHERAHKQTQEDCKLAQNLRGRRGFLFSIRLEKWHQSN